ncbi:lysozyme inhibitor LprI family protein [Morganella psychrotolerans]|uniref:UmoC n=1 Tax=Morganella psychrotolerans TaxID=368603 RepID=A0A1B8HS45_9GAMM|nr:lysozyme inhibitor LprI family protein [Morganella psychrotolerans]OBU12248.1 UmoC [Morganella psychrotolerans]
MKYLRTIIISGFIGSGFTFSATSVAGEKTTNPLEQCYESVGDAPRTELTGCLTAKFNTADIQLKNVVKQEKNQLASLKSAGSKKAIKSLNTSQAAFTAFRDTECQRRYDAALGGSGAGDFMKACQIELTEWRIQQLQAE